MRLSKKQEYRSGVGMITIGVLFVILKLTDTIDWSWFFVLLPFILTTIIVVTIVFFVFLYVLVVLGYKGIKNKLKAFKRL